MKHNRYDTIICDFGNVLINFDHRIAVREIAGYTPKAEADIYNLFFDSSFTKLFEEGKIFPEEFFKRVKEFLMLKMEYSNFITIWNKIFFETSLNIKIQDFLRKCRPYYKLVLLSNINKTHFEYLEGKVDILKEFDRLVLSYEEGFRKPDAEIYKIAVESVNTVYSKAFYIDDRRDLIDSALKIGINGIVFDNELALEGIKKELNAEIFDYRRL